MEEGSGATLLSTVKKPSEKDTKGKSRSESCHRERKQKKQGDGHVSVETVFHKYWRTGERGEAEKDYRRKRGVTARGNWAHRLRINYRLKAGGSLDEKIFATSAKTIKEKS